MHDLLPFLPDAINNVISSFPYFMPELYLAILFIVVLVTDLFFGRGPEKKLCRIIACAGILLVVHKDYQQISLLLLTGQGNGHFLFTEMLLLNYTAISFKLVIDALAFILILYFKWDNKLSSHPKGLQDLYTIAIGALLSLHLMVMAVNLLSIYLSIEMVSIASYLMVAYRSESSFSAGAGLKYVLFGAASSAIMLYGISLLYGFGGSLSLFTGNLIPGMLLTNPAAVTIALLFVLVGIGFKLSFVPMHFWVPDVYEGAATPVTAWLSTLPKIAGFALLVNFLGPFIFNPQFKAFDFRFYLEATGIITMIAGNFAAVMQNNIKRMLAYSSIGHIGFALMAVVVFSSASLSALVFYMAVYGAANIGALVLATYFANVTGAENVKDYKGFGLKLPVASICFVIVLVSLTGLPITAGFNGKLLVFSAAYSFYQQNHPLLMLPMMVTGAVATVVALFYYIKIPRNLFLKQPESILQNVEGSRNLLILSVIICLVLILLGLRPDLLINHI